MNIQDNFTNSGYTCYSVVDVIVGKVLNFETNSTLQKIHKSAKNLFPPPPRPPESLERGQCDVLLSLNTLMQRHSPI